MTSKAPKGKAKANDSSRLKAPKAAKGSIPGGTNVSRRTGQVKRLRPGELDGLVLGFMRKHEKDLPMSPTTIAKRITRSSGAVANCLDRLAKAKKARLANKAPREYDLPRLRA